MENNNTMDSKTMEKVAIKAQTSITLNLQTLQDLFTTALEGGINYWAQVEDYDWDREDWYAKISSVESCDQFEDDDVLTINKDTIVRGIEILMSHPSRKWARRFLIDIEEEMFDAETADVVAQLGLFEELIYG